MEEGKLDGDSGIVTTEGSDAGSLHGSEPCSEPSTEASAEPSKPLSLLDTHRIDFLTSQLVQAKPCVVTDDEDVPDHGLFWMNESSLTLDSPPTYVHVNEPQPYEQTPEAPMIQTEPAHTTLIRINDLFDTGDSPPNLPHSPLIPEMVDQPVKEKSHYEENEAIQMSLEQSPSNEILQERNPSPVDDEKNRRMEHHVLIEVSVNLPPATSTFIEVSEEDNKVTN